MVDFLEVPWFVVGHVTPEAFDGGGMHCKMEIFTIDAINLRNF
jgi:dihydroxyacid dehydratase/phosphogluconate dehydratase